MARDRRPRDDEDDEDDRPRAKRRRDEEKEEEEPRPKRKPRPADDEEEERPRRKTRARDDQDDDEEDDRPRRKGKKAGMSKGLLFGLIGGGAALVLVVVLLIVFLGGGGTVSGPPKAVFEAYIKDMKNGRHSRGYEYLSKDAKLGYEQVARKEGTTAMARFIEHGGEMSWVVMNCTVVKEQIEPSGLGATLTIKTEWPGGARPKGTAIQFPGDNTELVHLVKEDGKWKIDF